MAHCDRRGTIMKKIFVLLLALGLAAGFTAAVATPSFAGKPCTSNCK